MPAFMCADTLSMYLHLPCPTHLSQCLAWASHVEIEATASDRRAPALRQLPPARGCVAAADVAAASPRRPSRWSAAKWPPWPASTAPWGLAWCAHTVA